MRLRPAVFEDQRAVLRVVEAVLRELGLWEEHKGRGLEDLLALPASYEGGAFLVLEDRGKVVGCGGLMPLDADTAAVQRMYFLPSYRGRGLGRKLLEALLERARKLGFRDAVLETSPRFYEAIALYDRLGFEPVVSPCGGCCNVRMARAL